MTIEERIAALETRVAKLEEGRLDSTTVFPALNQDCGSLLADTAVTVVAELARKYSERNLLIDELAARNTSLHREIEALKGNKPCTKTTKSD